MIHECYAEFCSELMLLKQQRKYGLAVIATEEADGAIVESHDLARETEADAGAIRFGGEKGYEYLRLTLATDRCTVVDNVDAHGVGWRNGAYDVDSCGSGLDGITDEVDEYLRDLTFVGIEQYIVGSLDITACNMGVGEVLR